MAGQTLRSVGRAATRKNDDPAKPNEDVVLVDDDRAIYIVCDGVTRSIGGGRYPDPSPSARAAALFAETAHRRLANRADEPIGQVLAAAIGAANQAIAAYNRSLPQTINYLDADFAGTVAIVAVAQHDTLHYAYLGDCAGYLLVDRTCTRLTRPQTEAITAYRREVGHGDAATIEIRRSIRNNKQHPLGFGVFTGENSALDLVEYGSVGPSDRAAIVLCSDGVAPAIEHDPIGLLDAAPETIVQAAARYEIATGARSDDKSAIVIRFERR